MTAIIFSAVVRVRLLQMPLERDEGEYAFAGQLLLQGIPPYREAFNMKFPGVYAAYAVMMAVFGQSIAGIHLGFLLWNAATILLVFLLGKRLMGSAHAAYAAAGAAAYAVLSLSPGVIGTSAHATHFVVLPAAAACLLLLHAIESSSPRLLAGAGLLFGIAIVMKQHGVFFAIFGMVWLLWARRRDPANAKLRNVLIFSGGTAVPLAVTVITLWTAGVLGNFWFWTFDYARAYVSELSLSTGFDILLGVLPRVVGRNFPIWIFAAAALLLLWWNKDDRVIAGFLTGLSLFSFLAICPGFYFREHYFVLLLPALALLTGAGLRSLERLFGRALPIALCVAILGFAIFQRNDFFFQLSPLQASRRIFGFNPFPEAIPVAEYLRTHSPENARIVVIGSEPEIYFYSHRRSVTGFIYTYPMMEPQPYALQMQEELIHDIQAGRPLYVVQVNSSASWLARPDSSRRIFEWWRDYRGPHYNRVGMANVLSEDQTVYRWGENLERSADQAGVSLEVYRLKD